jgi:general secretion pathway protein C
MALTVNNILASQLAPYTVPELPKMEAPAAARPAPSANIGNWDRAIARLCLFGCPETEPAQECPGGCAEGEQCQAGVCVPADGAQPVNSNVPVLSDLNMQMMGAMVASDPQFSMALIRDEASNATMILGVGDMLGSDAQIIEIRRDRVMLKRNGRTEYIRMDKTLGGVPTATTISTAYRPPAVRAAPSDPLPKAPRAAEPSSDPVRKVSDNHFEVQREAIARTLDNPRAMRSQGRIVPNFKNGERDGLKLVGLSPDSIYTQLGIQSGDVLQALNGEPVNTTQQAMELFQALKSSGEVTIEIERRGQTERLQYKIR